jgi:hypothetical protein
MIWSFVAVCITYVFGTLITASGDLRTLNLLAAGGMVLNIGLNLVLIPRWQRAGRGLGRPDHPMGHGLGADGRRGEAVFLATCGDTSAGLGGFHFRPASAGLVVAN